MKDNNLNFPSKYFSRKPLQVCSSMLPLFYDKFKIRDAPKREIKNLLLKTNNKQNRTISNSVEKSDGYWSQVLDRCSLFCKSCRSRIAKSGLWLLSEKNLRHRSGASVVLIFSTTVLIGRITGNITGLIHLLFWRYSNPNSWYNFLQDCPFIAPVIVKAALYCTVSSLLEKAIFEGWS